MATRSSKNNILAGVFVLTSILLAVATAVALSDISAWFQASTKYQVRFPLEVGAGGLQAGSQVRVGGQQVGTVLAWAFDRKSPKDDPTGVLVTIEMRSDIKPRTEAMAFLVLPLLGSGAAINFESLGTGEPVPPNGMIKGMMAPPAFLAQAGYGPEQASQVQDIIARVQRITVSVEENWDPKISGVLDDVRTVTADVRERWPEWRGKIDTAFDAAGKFGPIVDDVKVAVADAKAMIEDNRPRVDDAVKNVQELAQKFNTKGWEDLQAILEKGRKGLDDFADIAEKAAVFVRQELPELRTVVANARLASDQLKLTTAEVRAAPWKLLAPVTGRKDLENEALFESARAYAVAVSNLRAASEALQSTTAGGDVAGEATIKAMVADIEAAFRTYKAAEKNFLLKLEK
ncbi:MAG: hypothetical protein KF745_12200 [Phycisphaeraceae bacterium]|nr:hypothetical protein [Phycisphaeraceae bacterium]